jgi:hypothetical protein
MPVADAALLFDQLEIQVRACRSAYEKCYADNVALAADNVAKQELIDEMRATWTPPATGPEPEPPAFPLYVGATVGTRNQTIRQAITEWETNCGTLAIRRIFMAGAPTTTNLASQLGPDYGKRHRILSYKGDTTMATLKTIQNDGFTTFLVKYHEPENDGGTHTPAWFVAEQAKHIAQVKGLNRPDLVPAFVLMSWSDRDGDASTSSKDWFPTDKDGVVFFIDPYDPNNRNSLEQTCAESVRVWRAEGGERWGVAETGTHRLGLEGAQWIKDGHAYLKREGAEAYCWFHHSVGAEGPWWLDDKTMQAAWKDIAML